ncbi:MULTISPECIES: hypothetical protein [unclassified Yoonia]|uniref:hypothetical protein n=1 Tax=unclassified Yoonia TaxID=2629118 RepID=UPI002AFED695|nr:MULTISPECIES: hypothetical protein [unclassified Yoonia]
MTDVAKEQCETADIITYYVVPLRADPILGQLALAMVLSLLLTVPAFLLDDRLFNGANVWLKPIKFQIALALYFATLTVYATWLPEGVMRSTKMRVFLTAVVVATIAEMLWISGAAMFATASHYNPVPLLYAIYAAMGAFAVLLTAVSLVLGMAFWRDRGSALPAPFRLSLALGLIATFVLTLIAAGTLSALPGHHVGTPVTGATVPFMGWSREVGDLRVSHFLATHALHVIPVIGLAAMALRPPRLARLAVWVGTAGFAALTLFTFAQALSGRPFI